MVENHGVACGHVPAATRSRVGAMMWSGTMMWAGALMWPEAEPLRGRCQKKRSETDVAGGHPQVATMSWEGAMMWPGIMMWPGATED